MKFGPVQQFVWSVDYLFCKNLIEVLISNILSQIPISLTQGIHNFATGPESWLAVTTTDCHEELIQIKLSAVSVLAQTLRRCISLNHARHFLLKRSFYISVVIRNLTHRGAETSSSFHLLSLLHD
jgi:hypothetical protein